MRTSLVQLSEYFLSLGQQYTAKRIGQFEIYEPYIYGENLCKRLADLCLAFDETDLSRSQSRLVANKLRVIGKLIAKDLE